MHTIDAEGGKRPTTTERKRTNRREVGRRPVLRALGGAGVVALAGCLGDGDSTGGADDAPSDDASGEASDDGSGIDDASGFGRSARFADSYAFEMENPEEGDTFRWSGRVDGDDSYMRMEEDGEVMEIYAVGGESYLVQGGGCFRMTPEEYEGDEAVEEPEMSTHEEEAAAHPELEPAGRETIDGEEVYVFELSAEEAAEHDERVTYYVSVETGYLRRVEDGESVMDFHSWGDVDPIEPPEMECMELGDRDEPGETSGFRLARGR